MSKEQLYICIASGVCKEDGCNHKELHRLKEDTNYGLCNSECENNSGGVPGAYCIKEKSSRKIRNAKLFKIMLTNLIPNKNEDVVE